MSEIKNEKNTAPALAEENTGKAEKKKDKKPVKNKKEKGGLKKFLKSRKARHGTVAIAIVAVVIAIVIVLNVVVSLLVERFPDIVLDFTADNSFALEDDTTDYVSHIEKDIKITVLAEEEDFESSGNYYIQANKLLEKMASASDGKISLSYIDITANPTFAQQYSNVDWSTNNNVMIVECGEDYKALTFDDLFEYDQDYYSYYGEYYVTGSLVEQAVVTAILNVTTEDKVVVDVITGNQEQDYSGVVSLLETNAYKVNEISLLTGDISEDAEFLVLFAPSVDLDESAVEKISTWLDNSGKYGRNLIYIPCENSVDTPNLDLLLEQWGMQVEDGYIFETDTNRLITSSSIFVFTVNQSEEYYYDGLKNPNIPIASLWSRAISITDESIAHPLLTTSEYSGICPVDADESWDYNESIGNEALNIGAEGLKTNTDGESSRVIVYGSNAMFASDVLSYNSYNNSAYLMNVFNTIADKDDTGITIEGKSMESETLGITDVTTKNIIFTFFVVIIPIAVLVTGIVVWLRRRNK